MLAEAQFKKALEERSFWEKFGPKDEFDSMINTGLANAFYGQGRKDEAINIVDKILKRAKDGKSRELACAQFVGRWQKPLLSIAAVAFSTAALAGSGVALAKSINVFKAGSYTKTGASLSTLVVKDLRYASKAENVAGLLDLAQNENRIDTLKAMQLSGSFSSLHRGDELLLTCLKNAKCQPDSVYAIAKNSDIHADVLARNSALGATQVNDAVGAINESLMLRFFTSSGWKAVDGQVGRTGFDGLLVKVDDSGSVRDLLIVESKFNTSALKSTNHGTQMSDEWVRRKIQALRSQAPENDTYRQIDRIY